MESIYRIDVDGGPRHAVRRDGVWHALDGDLFGSHTVGAAFSDPSPRVLAPLVPSKIVAVGLNYKDHAAEMNKPLPDEPLIFLKPSTAVVGPGDEIVIPTGAGRVDYEAEVAVVIGRVAHHVTAARAHEYVLGLTCLNDVTDRDLQKRDVQYTRAKGFDTFAPMGPCIVAIDLDRPIGVRSMVNGESRQDSTTGELIFPIRQLVEFVTAVMTLLPGDIISTGTPPGVGPLAPGDQVTIAVDGVGELVNDVVAAKEHSE
jgi:2-keto-4-pentenoate hydratase/2-oxohepta-3-ene-1,7-dioic acid hydratase in catechol pathway